MVRIAAVKATRSGALRTPGRPDLLAAPAASDHAVPASTRGFNTRYWNIATPPPPWVGLDFCRLCLDCEDGIQRRRGSAPVHFGEPDLLAQGPVFREGPLLALGAGQQTALDECPPTTAVAVTWVREGRSARPVPRTRPPIGLRFRAGYPIRTPRLARRGHRPPPTTRQVGDSWLTRRRRAAFGHDQSHRVGPLGDPPGHGARESLA
jgi:hypothetical protein